ncbi:MAG TPA: hypothetical protein VEP90_06985 [Methylomirabilota bacterium]|nr:hypothetical protein [Methylomirabilota bacterium]
MEKSDSRDYIYTPLACQTRGWFSAWLDLGHCVSQKGTYLRQHIINEMLDREES